MKQVQVRTSGTTEAYQDLTNKWGSDWEMANAPKFPLDINIIGADGDSVSAPSCDDIAAAIDASFPVLGVGAGLLVQRS